MFMVHSRSMSAHGSRGVGDLGRGHLPHVSQPDLGMDGLGMSPSWKTLSDGTTSTE